MANGQIKEIHSEARPRVRSRPHRSRLLTENEPPSSWIALVGYFLSGVINILPGWLIKLCPNWLGRLLRWCPTSPQALEAAEQKVLSYLERPYTVKYVNIGPGWESEEDHLVWTLTMNADENAGRTPLVLMHGFASGIGLWVMNLDSLSSSRPVYAFDMLGFGRSSRPTFSNDAQEAESQLINSVEKWRKAVGLEKFILLGHSMGGYVAASYALHYAEHVALLLLVDPWGFPERPISLSHQYQMPRWVKIANSLLHAFNPLAGVRAAGPVGPMLVVKFRGDLRRKFMRIITDRHTIPSYVYHCNAQKPSGEIAFKALTGESGWAKYPMVGRITELRWEIPITFIYGSRSWVNRQPGLQIKYTRLNSIVDVQVIQGAGHHAYADKPEQFNTLVHRVCDRIEYAQLLANKS